MRSPGYRVISDYGELERLAPAWLELLGRSATNEPTVSPIWLLNWWRVFGPLQGRRLVFFAFYDGTRLIGIAPLLKRRYWFRGVLPFVRLEPLGTGERIEDEVCSDYTNLAAERGAEAKVARSLAEALRRGAAGRWHECLLPLSAGDNAQTDATRSAFRDMGLKVSAEQTAASPYIALPGSWQAYLSALDSSSRYYVSRSLRDFDGWADGRAEFSLASNAGELEYGRRLLEGLHRERWNSGGEAGAFGSALFTQFHRAVQRDLLEAGALELMWLTVAGRPIAALYNIVWDNKVYFYQCGRATGLPKGIRAGVVLHAHAIKRSIEAGRREYDFLGGSSQYKEKLAMSFRPIIRTRAARHSVLELVRSIGEAAVARVRGRGGSGQRSAISD